MQRGQSYSTVLGLCYVLVYLTILGRIFQILTYFEMVKETEDSLDLILSDM